RYRNHIAIHSFPTRRSSDLRAVCAASHRRSSVKKMTAVRCERETNDHDTISTDKNTDDDATSGSLSWLLHDDSRCHDRQCGLGRDRKSTRLNSSHGSISYAV